MKYFYEQALLLLYTLDLYDLISSSLNSVGYRELLLVVCSIDLLGLFYFGKKLLKATKLFFKYRDVSKDIENISKALLDSLVEGNIFSSNTKNLQVKTEINNYGEVFIYLEGGTNHDNSIFIKSLDEIINPINNPRYIISRKKKFWRFFMKKDYHSVPEVLGKRKELASIFQRKWTKYVNDSELFFTRSIEGRQQLLKFRFNSLATEVKEKAQRINRWK